MRALAVVVLLAGLFAASFGLATASGPSRPSVANQPVGPHNGLDVIDTLPAPGTFSIPVTARAPLGGPDFGVAVYRNRAGQLCLAFGRTIAGRIGAAGPDGAFVDMPLEHGGTCLPAWSNSAPSAGIYYASSKGVGMVVWGIAKRSVVSIELRASTGVHTIRPGRHGVFLLPLRKTIGPGRALIRSADGSTSKVRIPDFAALRKRMRATLDAPRDDRHHR